MTAIDGTTSNAETGPKPEQVVRVSRATIEAARARLAISRQLGRPVSKVVEKIAAIR